MFSSRIWNKNALLVNVYLTIYTTCKYESMIGIQKFSLRLSIYHRGKLISWGRTLVPWNGELYGAAFYKVFMKFLTVCQC